jgi:hypothetical protein
MLTLKIEVVVNNRRDFGSDVREVFEHEVEDNLPMIELFNYINTKYAGMVKRMSILSMVHTLD